MSRQVRTRSPVSRFSAPPTGPPEPVPDRLPAETSRGVIVRSMNEGETRGRMLASLVEYALREMPPGWRP